MQILSFWYVPLQTHVTELCSINPYMHAGYEGGQSCMYNFILVKVHQANVLKHISLEYIQLPSTVQKSEVKPRLPSSPEIPLNITLSRSGLLQDRETHLSLI